MAEEAAEARHIVSVRIKNFLSLVDVEIRPGKITQIVGDNNQGKTSIIKALGFAVQGSNDPNLVRLGQDSAEVLLQLSDETLIRRRINSEGRQSVTIEKGSFSVSAPQGMLNALFDHSSFNPLDLMDPKARNEAILKSIDFRLTPDQLAEEVGRKVEDLPPLDYEQHGLRVIEHAHKYFYQRRAEANKTAAEKKKRFETYQKDLTELPPEPKLNRADILVEKNTRAQLIREEEQRIQVIKNLRDNAKRNEEKLAKYQAAAARIDEEIHDLEQKMMTAKARRIEADKFIESARADVQTDFPDHTQHEKEIQKLKLDIQNFDLMVKDWETREAVERQHSMVKGMQDEVTAADKFADDLTATVDALHGPIKKRLMEKAEMPVSGLEFRDGTFFLEGSSVDNLSTSAAIRLALAVARKLAKRTKVICLDGAEQLDAKTWALLCAETKDDGFNYFVTRVGEALPADGPVLTMKEGQVVQ